jgi:hypothetical protein
MKQKSKFAERYGRANQGFRPRNRNRQNTGPEEIQDTKPGRREKLAD